jgi:hypothetical protein
MKIRKLKMSDILRVSSLIKTYYDEIGGYRFSSFDRESVIDSLYAFLNLDSVYMVVAEEKDEILGVGVVGLFPSILNMKETKAVEFVWHSNIDLPKIKRGKVMLKILEHIEKEVRNRGASTLTIGIGVDNTLGPFLERKGFQFNERFYLKVVK